MQIRLFTRSLCLPCVFLIGEDAEEASREEEAGRAEGHVFRDIYGSPGLRSSACLSASMSLVEASHHIVEVLRPELPVDVERHGDRGVPELSLHALR